MVDRLRAAGIKPERIHACWPVVDLKKFRNRGPNGPDVMNVGAALPKKGMPLFADLAKRCPEIRFDLYMLGYDAVAIADYAKRIESPVDRKSTRLNSSHT